MTVNEAIEFFERYEQHTIVARLKPLQDVGLGYIKLGQSSSTLSGGENQRVKLAYYLSLANATPTLFIFDEPTTGLHFHDIKKLLDSFDRLVARGHTLVIIEHNLDVIKCADYLIDLGPDGGENGGRVIAVGTTSCRTLEGAVRNRGELVADSGKTDIFIYPGYQFQVIDALITNFHLPESTLLMLISALAGRDEVMKVYEHAIKERYRFFSFGDACFFE
jgi:energy-coupling factor transporter ATP-binding protein EcfA2